MPLDDYEIGKAIGSGKFSVVYKAKVKRGQDEGQVVALKRVQIFDIMDEKQREKCLKEVKLLQSLEHPNIIKYIDSFIAEQDLIIIFEWAELGDLRKLVRRAADSDTPFDEGMIWKYFVQIADALKYMHERRIMHRDLKPANVFITGSGYLKLGDLGLGRSFGTESFEAFSKVGTPLYMSPEVIHGKGYDWQSDVWSLGCILYELACLRNPFKEEDITLYDLFKKINACQYPPIPASFSPQLRELVRRILQLDPRQRPTTAEVFEVARRECAKHMAIRNRVPPHVLNDELVDRLILLDYERDYCRRLGMPPVARHYFAEPARDAGRQWHAFAALCSWLLGRLGGAMPAPQPDDDPAATAATIVSEMKRVGVAAEFAPSKLKASAHGDLPCFVLARLAEEAVARAPALRRLAPPAQPPDPEEALEEADADEADEEGAPGAPGWEEEEEAGPGAGRSASAATAIYSEADPELWREEARRLEPLLRAPVRVAESWRDRADLAAALARSVGRDAEEAAGPLRALLGELEEGAERLRGRERAAGQQLAPLVEAYREARGRLEAASARHAAAAAEVDEATNRLSALADASERLTREMDALSDAVTDHSPVAAVKRATARLQGEVRLLEVRMGVLRHILRARQLAPAPPGPPPPGPGPGGGSSSADDAGPLD